MGPPDAQGVWRVQFFKFSQALCNNSCNTAMYFMYFYWKLNVTQPGSIFNKSFN